MFMEEDNNQALNDGWVSKPETWEADDVVPAWRLAGLGTRMSQSFSSSPEAGKNIKQNETTS